MERDPLFAEPRQVEDLSDCFFYHVMDLPGVGLVGEQWDLRGSVQDYLGRIHYAGKRVLDVGTASGYLSFEMERRGAEVVSYDLGDESAWDVVPYHDQAYDLRDHLAHKQSMRERSINAYWYAHRALGSRARLVLGSIYDMPAGLGEFDVVVLGAILLHLRDPFRALLSVSKLAADVIVITDLHEPTEQAVMRFLPDAAHCRPADTWWSISAPCMVRMLEVLGFQVENMYNREHTAVLEGVSKQHLLTTYVAKRLNRRGS